MSSELNQLIRERRSTLYKVLSELDVTKLAASLDSLEKRVDTLNGTVNKFGQSIDKLEGYAEKHDIQIASISDNLEATDSALKDVAEKMDDIAQFTTALDLTVTQMRQYVDDEFNKIYDKLAECGGGSVVELPPQITERTPFAGLNQKPHRAAFFGSVTFHWINDFVKMDVGPNTWHRARVSFIYRTSAKMNGVEFDKPFLEVTIDSTSGYTTILVPTAPFNGDTSYLLQLTGNKDTFKFGGTVESRQPMYSWTPPTINLNFTQWSHSTVSLPVQYFYYAPPSGEEHGMYIGGYISFSRTPYGQDTDNKDPDDPPSWA